MFNPEDSLHLVKVMEEQAVLRKKSSKYLFPPV
jgi:hypothetical protein